ncbi:hypothetical protein PC9H_005213 [Pleurotus ostreatus]|uniref:Uncharacterized protein n=1 Tax=Pleurotus ostreatus TaxID=5322 RepID=A0A8H7A0B1_PLEOS|nr:uncharacterized protein PC9H_005213 [Pleurotus ostreatus]KAF7433263.1 hypothetical protein PC9H_005213 [Pleurotus ostreatus]
MLRCLPKANHHTRRAARLVQRRPLHVSAPSALSAPASLQQLLDESSSSIGDSRTRMVTELLNSLNRVSSASRVWAHYVGLLNVLRDEKLPVEVHQEVLRKCTPKTAEVRLAAARRSALDARLRVPHLQEGRFRTVIRNIRAMGETPALEDYHFILEQFAAVGHYKGAMEIYKELQMVGLTPRSKTFGLCLQTLAHRLTLPMSNDDRESLVAQIRDMHGLLLADMTKLKAGLYSVNFDISVRLLKETLDLEACERLLKLGYGIDLNNPDRPVLEYLHDPSTVADPLFTQLPGPQRFTTAGLNTVIDLLGRLGEVSKMVQTFEVLTEPLPSRATQHFSSTFDDDEDDYSSSISPPTPQHVPLPSASPNTTTYNTLIRHLSRAGHPLLARHYILQAMELDRVADRKIRGQLAYGLPSEQVPSLHFAINRGTLIPVLGEANRDKNVALIRWLQSKLPKILRRKRNDLAFYSAYKDQLIEEPAVEPSSEQDVPSTESGEPLPTMREAVDSAGSWSGGSTSADSAESRDRLTSEVDATLDLSRQGRSSADSMERPPPPSAFFVPSSSKSSPTSVLDLDLDAPPVVAPPIVKYFNIDLHLQLLARDIREIEEFSVVVENTLGRITQRLKERLGRRVWSSKDIWLRSVNRRMQVNKPSFVAEVNYRPKVEKKTVPSKRIPLRPISSRFARPGLQSPPGIASIHTAASDRVVYDRTSSLSDWVLSIWR